MYKKIEVKDPSINTRGSSELQTNEIDAGSLEQALNDTKARMDSVELKLKQIKRNLFCLEIKPN